MTQPLPHKFVERLEPDGRSKMICLNCGQPSRNPVHEFMETTIAQVNTLQEAKEWFIANAEGGVLAVKGEEKQRVFTYPQAENFYATANHD